MTTSRPGGSVGSPAGGSGRPKNSSTENSGTEVIRGFVDDVRELLQQELRTAQEELAGKARVASEGVLMLGVAVVLGALAAGASTLVIMRMLEKVLPRRWRPRSRRSFSPPPPECSPRRGSRRSGVRCRSFRSGHSTSCARRSVR